jgi:hypothetical protein
MLPNFIDSFYCIVVFIVVIVVYRLKGSVHIFLTETPSSQDCFKVRTYIFIMQAYVLGCTTVWVLIIQAYVLGCMGAYFHGVYISRLKNHTYVRGS